MSRERSLSKMKTKKNDSWMKPKGGDSGGDEPETTSEPSPMAQPPVTPAPSVVPSLPLQPVAPVASPSSPAPPSVPSIESRPLNAKYSTVAFDSSSSSDDSDKEDDEEKEKEEDSAETKPESPRSKFCRVSQWLSDEEHLSTLEDFFGVENSTELKEDVNALTDPETNETLLHRACSHGLINIVQCLIEGAGSEVNALDKDGRTPLHYAIRSSHALVAKYLIKQCGSDLNQEDESHLTPLALCRHLLAEAGQGQGQTEEASLTEIRKVLEKYEKKSMEKRMKITQPVYRRAEEGEGGP
jgi:hypothetical protein